MMNSQRLKWLIIILLVLWIFFVLGSFFVVQKPFSADNALAMGRVLLDLLTAAWLTLIALGLGSWLLSRLRLDLSLAEIVVFGAGMGFGGLSLLSFALGLAGLFRPVVAYIVTIALTGLVAPQLLSIFRQIYRRRSLTPYSSLRAPTPFLSTVYCLLIALFTLLTALLPPTDWDGLFYHLTGPQLYLQAGGVVGGLDIPHLSFPSLMEMLFAWAMLLRGDITAKLLHTCFGLLLAGLVYLTAARFLSKKAAWLAVLIFASMPLVGTLAGWAYNDLALAFYQLGAVYGVIRWQIANGKLQIANDKFKIQNPPSKISWLILSGILAGLAMGLKYTAFVTPVVIVGMILWYGVKFQREAAHYQVTSSKVASSRVTNTPYALRFAFFVLRAALFFILPALLVALPWYVKNLVFTGNPMYPFLFDLFGGHYWDQFRATWYAAAGTGVGWQPGTLLALPWLLTLGVRDMNYWDGRTGPLLLLFLPLVVWAGLSRRAGRPAALGLLLIYALGHFVVWTVGVIWSRSLWQSRLLLPGLAALAPVIGWVWADLSRLDTRQFSLSRFVNIAIGLTLALTVVDTGLLTLKINPLPYLVGLENRDDYLTRRLGTYYAAMQQINEKLPPAAKVLFLWEPRSYYCQRYCQPDSILDTLPHLVYQYGSAGAITHAWRQAGVTHVLIYRTGLNFMLTNDPGLINVAMVQELEQNHLRLVFDIAGAYQLYALR